MSLGRYRITQPTIAVFAEDGRQVARMVPAGSIVTIDGASLDDDKLVEVTWDGTKVTMFAQDLRSRAEAAPDS